MKRPIAAFILLFCNMLLHAQKNCSLYEKGSPSQRACEYYEMGCIEPQGTRISQQHFDSAIAISPSFALAHYEKSVPFLKRGDFYNWRKHLDAAVKLDPKEYLGARAWCMFKFLSDHENALADLMVLDSLTGGDPGYSGDGEYDLHMIKGICYRELGNPAEALRIFNDCISRNEKRDRVGNWDYLHRGITRLKMGDPKGALTDFEKQAAIYPRLADNFYYMGLAYRQAGDKEAARKCLENAKAQYLSGYEHNDPYSEVPDDVYLDDIGQAILELGK